MNFNLQLQNCKNVHVFSLFHVIVILKLLIKLFEVWGGKSLVLSEGNVEFDNEKLTFY